MPAIPKSTFVTTFALLGIGILLVIAMLIFSFSILRGSQPQNVEDQSEEQKFNFPTPTPEYIPNEGIIDFNEEIINEEE